MKKNPIIFIAMLIALAFTSCQMNSDDNGVNPVVPPAPTYKITVTATNGTASYPKTAKAGEKVTITATADSGYVFDSASSALSIPDYKVSEDLKSITWNLTMPEKDVTINVAFKTATPTPTTEATYTITVTGDQTNGSAKVTNAFGEVITSAKVGETVTLTITPKNGYNFDATIAINGQSETQTDNAERSYTMAMPSSNITVNVSFTQISNNNGGEDNNGEPPATTTEYTVSVASGIKGGYIEVSTDNVNWTKLSAPVKYEKKTNLYVRAQPANSFYELITLEFTSSNGEYGTITTNSSHCIPINADTTLNATFEIGQRSLSTLDCEMTTTYTTTDDYKNSEYRILIKISNAKFEAGWNKAKIALGFDEEYYSGLTETNLVNGPKYYYVFPIGISSFMKTFLNPYPRFAFVGINGENFEMPEVGKLYLILENSNDNQTSLYPITNSDTSNPKFFSVAVTE